MANSRKTYENATVIGNTLKKANNGTDFINICCSVDIGEEKPKRFFGSLFLTYAAGERTYKTLRDVFKWEGSKISDFNNPILKGKKCNIVVEDNGEYQNIVFFNKCFEMDKLDSNQLESVVNDFQPILDEIMKKDGSYKEPVLHNNTNEQTESENFQDGSPINTKYEDVHF